MRTTNSRIWALSTSAEIIWQQPQPSPVGVVLTAGVAAVSPAAAMHGKYATVATAMFASAGEDVKGHFRRQVGRYALGFVFVAHVVLLIVFEIRNVYMHYKYVEVKRLGRPSD